MKSPLSMTGLGRPTTPALSFQLLPPHPCIRIPCALEAASGINFLALSNSSFRSIWLGQLDEWQCPYWDERDLRGGQGGGLEGKRQLWRELRVEVKNGEINRSTEHAHMYVYQRQEAFSFQLFFFFLAEWTLLTNASPDKCQV